MNKSESIKNLATALVKTQADMPAAPMNATNPFLKNRFADLGSVISTAQPILEKHGLAISQFPVSVDGKVGITTILMHESGEWLAATIELPISEEKGKSIAQVAGSIITYLRRYSLSAVLNMYADEDVDGNQSEEERKGKEQKKSKSSKRNGWPVRPWDAEMLGQAMAAKVAAYKGKGIMPTQEQLDYCRSSLGKLNLNDPERHTVTLYLFDVESTGDLTAAQCSALIDWIGAKPPHYEASQDAKVEARAVIKQYQVEAGQAEMAL